MKKNLSAFAAITLIVSLITSATAQTASRRNRAQGEASQKHNPAIVLISDRQLLNYATQRSGEVFTVTVYQVGNFKTISGGEAFEQQQPPGTNDLMISFRLQPGTNPQLEQSGNQLSIYFRSSGASGLSIPRAAPFTPRDSTFANTAGRLPESGAVLQNARQVDVQGVAVPRIANEPIDSIVPLGIPRVSNITAEESDRCTMTEPTPDDPKDGFVIIDANTGKILEGATRVGENTRLKVAFVNKNPFKYDYSFQLIPKDVGNATVLSFLSLIPGIPNIPGILEGTIQPATSTEDANRLATAASIARTQGDAAPALRDDCAIFAIDLDTAVKNSERMAKALKDASDVLKTASNGYATFLKETDKTFNRGNREARMTFAKSLCESGRKVLPKLQAVLDFDFDAFSKSLKSEVFSAQVTLLEGRLGSLQCDEAKTSLYKKVIAALKVDVATYISKLEELKKAVADGQKKLEPPAKIVKAALGSSNSFAEAAYAPSLGDATSVSVTITRKNLRDENPKEEVIAVSPPLEIGEPRIILSGGIGFSTINERKVVRQQSLVPDASGAMVLGNRFGFENRSQFRPSGVIMINGILSRFNLFGTNKASLALSGGLVFSNRTDGLAAEFVAGPSLGLANNRMFLTFGFHAARVEELSGNFKIGDPVPDNLADPLPLQKNWKNGLIMGITFKIQPQ